MRLEEEIHQSTFRNEWQKAAINLLFTYGWVSRRLKEHLRPFGVSIQQYNVLRILNGSFPEPLTTSTIASRMLDKASDASRIVDRMHQKGWVEKTTCKKDKRLVDVKLSPQGLALVEKLKECNEAIDATLQNLSEEEARQLSELLNQLRG